MGSKRERRRNKATWPDRRLEIYSSDSMIDNLARNSSVGMLAEGRKRKLEAGVQVDVEVEVIWKGRSTPETFGLK